MQVTPSVRPSTRAEKAIEEATQYAAIDVVATRRAEHGADEPVYSDMAEREPVYRNVDANGMPIGDGQAGCVGKPWASWEKAAEARRCRAWKNEAGRGRQTGAAPVPTIAPAASSTPAGTRSLTSPSFSFPRLAHTQRQPLRCRAAAAEHRLCQPAVARESITARQGPSTGLARFLTPSKRVDYFVPTPIHRFITITMFPVSMLAKTVP